MRRPVRLIAVSLAGLALVGGTALGLSACSGGGPEVTIGGQFEPNPDDYGIFTKQVGHSTITCVTGRYGNATLSCVVTK